MEYIIYSFLASLILFFNYNTDVFVQYVRLFRLNRLFGVDKYDEHVDKFPDNSYWDFLLFERNSFLTRLISCPVCTSFWLNLGLFYFYRDLVVLVLNIWMTLFLYFILCVMYNRTHE